MNYYSLFTKFSLITYIKRLKYLLMATIFSKPQDEAAYLRDQATRQSIKAATDPDPAAAQRAAKAAADASKAATYKDAEIAMRANRGY